MAKRAADKRAATPRAKKKASAEAPFFRPFATLARDAKARKDDEQRPSATRADEGTSAAKTKAASGAHRAKSAPASKPSPAPAPRRDAPADEAPPVPVDPETFAIYMAGVRALDDRATRIPTTASRVERAERGALPAVDPDRDARERLRSLVSEGLRFEVSDDGESLEGRRVDLDPRDLRRLRRGAFAVDGRLDLHGMSATEARAALEAFVKKKQADGDRVVVIIHGKGSHSPRGVGILRGEIGAWLSQGRVARHVAAFTSAPADEGGGGALLVLLAR